MCGIVGVVSGDLRQLNAETALASLAHRGPDTGDFIVEDHGDKSVFLGHRRLSILDLTDAGKQPMSENGVTLIYNGEIYNYAELKRAHLGGQSFRSNTDTEVILRLYLKFGMSFLNHLRGDFAMAILDRNEQKVVLARDPVGVKPLYVYRSGETLAFASEIKALRAAGLNLTFDREAVSDFLVFKYNPLQQTLFQEVKKLTPGSSIEFDLTTGRESERRFKRLTSSNQPFGGRLRQATGELRERLDEAIRLRLMGDVPIANFLSGGIDSSIIAYALKEGNHTHYCSVKSRSDLKAEGTTSDGYYAKRLAKDWDLDLRLMPIGLDSLSEEELDRAVWSTDELIADGSIIPAMLMAEQAARRHRVVLSGMGADELFFGYNGHYLTRWNQMAGKIPALKKMLVRAFGEVSGNRGSFKAYRRYMQKWGSNADKPYEIGRFSVVGDVDSALRIQKRPGDVSTVFQPYFDESANSDPFDALFRFEMDNFLVKNLHYLDGASMAHGLESRVPFLDTEVVEFAATLPAKYKLSYGFNAKKILKLAYAEALPPYVVRRRKAGFGMPLRSIFGDERTLDRWMPHGFIESSDLFDMDEVTNLKREHLEGRRDHSALLYAIICLGRWHAMFVEDTAADQTLTTRMQREAY